MSDKWPLVPLRDIMVKIGSGATPRGGKSVYQDKGVAFIRSQNVHDGRFTFDGLARISDQAANALRGVEVLDGDVLICITGESVTRTAMASIEALPARVSQHVAILRPDPTRVSPRFLMSALLAPSTKEYLNSLSSAGATRRALTKGHLQDTQIRLPPVREQHRIALVLGTLDDLIEVNRRTVAAALDVSRASFSQIAARSEEFVKLRDATRKIGSGATPRGGKEVYQNAGVSFVRSQNIYDGRFSFDGLARISDAAAEVLSGVTVHPGDVLINITGESVTRTALVPDRALPARVSQHVAIVRPDPEVLDSGFLMLALLSGPIKAHLNGLSTAGATRRALTKAHLGETRIPFPPLVEQRRVSRMLRIVDELSTEIADLTRARDELLPLLMSGKVRVSEEVV